MRISTSLLCLSEYGENFEGQHVIEGKCLKEKWAGFCLGEPSVTATENIIMMAVLCGGMTVIHNAASEPHVVGLCEMLISMGAKIKGIGTNRIDIEGVASLHGTTH